MDRLYVVGPHLSHTRNLHSDHLCDLFQVVAWHVPLENDDLVADGYLGSTQCLVASRTQALPDPIDKALVLRAAAPSNKRQRPHLRRPWERRAQTISFVFSPIVVV